MTLYHTYLMADDYPCDLQYVQYVLFSPRNFDVEHAPFHTITFSPSFKRSKYSLDDSQPPSFCWLVLLLASTWLMYAGNHWRRSVKQCFQIRLFSKALSSLEKLVIHFLQHDSLHGGKSGYWYSFLTFLLVPIHAFCLNCFAIH